MRHGVRIGVTGPDRGGAMAWLMTALALRRCGAVPVRITPAQPGDHDALDGFVIGGGSDVDPRHYGQERVPPPEDEEQHNSLLDWVVGIVLTALRRLFATPTVQAYDPERDDLERHCIRHARYHDLPVLGICRGAQLMNVVCGGTLHQSIGHFYAEETDHVRSVLPRKTIRLEEGSRLHDILAAQRLRVNALHDQSIDQLGSGLRVSAMEDSGVVQAIEDTACSFFVGVQWHPEYMPQSARQVRLFRALVGCARHVV